MIIQHLASAEITNPRYSMAFTLPPLPYDKTALAPHISAETLEFHHGKHHNAYVTNLNKLLEGKPEAEKSLEEIILSSDGGVFNNAAQVWNHTFYWNSMKPGGGGAPTGDLADLITRDFGSFDKFKEQFTAAATTQFGSGWAWLVFEQGKLAVTKTGNADLPLKHGQKAILTIDVWEHAYYIDYRNLRPKYIETFLTSLANWDFAAQNLKGLSSLAMRQLAAFLLLLAACDRPKTEPDSARPVSTASKPGPSVSGPGGGAGTGDSPGLPAPSASATASAASPLSSGPATGHASGFCSAALTPADIQAACGVAVTLVPGADADDIAGAPGGCSRRYAAGGRSLSLVLTRLASPALAKTSFDGQTASRKEEPEFKALTGLGEGARHYVSINLTGDLLSSVEWVNGPYLARVFSPKISSNGNQFEPICSLDKLEALARTTSARLK